MATISKITAGQTLWTVTTQRMGNTTIRQRVVHPVVVTAIDPEGRFVFARWNGNAERKYFECDVAKWKVKKPEPKGNIMGMPTY